MLRFGTWKYCHYVGAPPQLFDLATDPEELTDLASDRRFATTLAEGNTGCTRCSIQMRPTHAPSGDRPSSSRSTAVVTRRWPGDLGFTPAPSATAEIN